MIIRTIDDLSSYLDSDFAWRKKEISNLHFLIDQNKKNIGCYQVLGRCGVTILYAHWEGFIKNASRYFLEYVAMQRLRNNQLHSNLLTLSMRTSTSFSPNSRKYSEFGKLTDFYISGTSQHARLPYKTGLNTESNLTSKVLKEITWCLGIEYSQFESKEKFIDSRLLERRNHIAHGQGINIDIGEFDEMRVIVIDIMSNFKNEIENSVSLKKYLKP